MTVVARELHEREKVCMGSVSVIPASRPPGQQKGGGDTLTPLKTSAKASLPPHTARALAPAFPSQKQLGQEGCAPQAWQKSQTRSKREATRLPECLQCPDRAAGMAGPGQAPPGAGGHSPMAPGCVVC